MGREIKTIGQLSHEPNIKILNKLLTSQVQ